MKVFSLLSRTEIWTISRTRGIAPFITCMVIRAFCTLLYGCGVVFICVQAVQILSSDKRIAPHFLIVLLSHRGNGMCLHIAYMNDFKHFRVGNPVLVDGNVVHIKAFPTGSNSGFDGFIVTGDSIVKKESELSGIPIDKEVIKRYCLFKEDQSDYLVFDGNGKRVVYHPDDGFFSINGEPGGYVSYLHELSNIIEEICGYPLSRYYGHTSQQAVDNRLRPTSSKDNIRLLAYRNISLKT